MRKIHIGTDVEQIVQLRSVLISELEDLYLEIVFEDNTIIKQLSLTGTDPNYPSDDVVQIDDTAVTIRLHRAETELYELGRYFLRVILVRPNENFEDAKMLSGTSTPIFDVVKNTERTSEGDKALIYTSIDLDGVLHNSLNGRDFYPAHSTDAVSVGDGVSFPHGNLTEWMGYSEQIATLLGGLIPSAATYSFSDAWGGVPNQGEMLMDEQTDTHTIFWSYKETDGNDYSFLGTKLIAGTIIDIRSTDPKKQRLVELTENAIRHDGGEYFELELQLLSRPDNYKDLVDGDEIFVTLYPAPFQIAPPQYDYLVNGTDVIFDCKNVTVRYGELFVTQDFNFEVINTRTNGFYDVVFINNSGSTKTLTPVSAHLWFFKPNNSDSYSEVTEITIPTGRSVLRIDDFNDIVYAKF